MIDIVLITILTAVAVGTLSWMIHEVRALHEAVLLQSETLREHLRQHAQRDVRP